MVDSMQLDERDKARFYGWINKDPGNGCWEWKGARTIRGYGRCRVKGTRARRAHRVMWEITHQKTLRNDQLVCHTCDNPACVKPEHLFIGSHQDNMDDKVRKNIKRGKGMVRLTVDIRTDQLSQLQKVGNRAAFVRDALDDAFQSKEIP